ncbi:MAG: NosD domain-containing protein [Candidatus Thermoplasmatota archaeon]
MRTTFLQRRKSILLKASATILSIILTVGIIPFSTAKTEAPFNDEFICYKNTAGTFSQNMRSLPDTHPCFSKTTRCEDNSENKFPEFSFRNTDRYAPGTILIKFTSDVSLSPYSSSEDSIAIIKHMQGFDQQSFAPIQSVKPLFSLHNQPKNSAAKEACGLSQWFVLKVPPNIDIPAEVLKYQQLPGVEYAQPSYAVKAYDIPNDPYYSTSGSWGQNFRDLYGLYNIQARSAWDTTVGSENVVVAVIDSGVDYNHEDLHENIWINHGEDINQNHVVDDMDFNGIDDDHNGFVDDIIGWDFVNHDNDPIDDHGHGTHCAGTIAAVGNNARGIVGVMWNCSVMPVKGLDYEGSGWPEDLAAGIQYAADNGAQILSNSWGYPFQFPSDPVLETAVRYAYAAGCLVVFAAGNCNDDVQFYSPQNMKEEVITVAAVDHLDQKAVFSNWGNLVDVSAPGVEILSLRARDTDMYALFGRPGSHFVPPYDPTAKYYVANGTSMACPHVAGLLGLMLSKTTNHTQQSAQTILMQAVDVLNVSVPFGHGRINASKALSREPAIAKLNPISPTGEACGVIDVYGTAWGVLFQSYTLELGSTRSPTTWTELYTSSAPVQHGVVGTINTTLLPDGVYTLRLTVYCSDGIYQDTTVMFVNNVYTCFIVDDDNIQGPWGGTNEHPYRYIQDAVEAAGSTDDIYVRAGTYTEHINIVRSANITGEDADVVVLSAPSIYPEVLKAEQGRVQITGFTIQGQGKTGLLLVNCSESRIANNHITDALIGLFIISPSATTISANHITHSYHGIFIQKDQCAVHNRIEHNYVSNCQASGIVIQSDRSWITNNTVSQCGGGISLKGTNNTIVQNTVLQSSGYGLLLYQSMYSCVSKNTVVGSSFDGFTLHESSKNTISYNRINDSGWSGVSVFKTTQNIFSSNTITNSTYSGFLLWSMSNANTIVGNVFVQNDYAGLYLGSGITQNRIFLNNFFDNTPMHAYDEGTNIWDNGPSGGGNYYDDYTGVDANYDGIGDSSYQIAGGSNQDRYPLIHPYRNIINTNTGEIFFTIQQAITDVDTMDGHMILVKDDTYSEVITLDKSIILRGADPRSTILDGKHTASCIVSVSADGATIQGFTIQHGSYGEFTSGIRITGDSNTVTQCIIQDTRIGILIQHAQLNMITDSLVTHNAQGIQLSTLAQSTIISNCTISRNNEVGIVFSETTMFCTVTNCTIENNTDGVLCFAADACNFSDNIVEHNTNHGVFLWYSLGCKLRRNHIRLNTYDFTVEGDIEQFDHDIDASNTVNSKPIIYLKHHSNLCLDAVAAGYLALISCRNISVKNLDVYGIAVVNTSNVAITTVRSHHAKYGILLCSVVQSTVANCILTNNTIGLLSTADLFYLYPTSSYNTITRNTIHSNEKGILLSKHSHHNTISANHIYMNTIAGIQVELSSSNTITRNTITRNLHGVYVSSELLLDYRDGSRMNTLTENIIADNVYGIRIRYIGHPLYYASDNNSIYHNTLYNNTYHAIDECRNKWSRNNEGNYYDDYTGVDANYDGIGDSSYPIAGGNNQDQYPLMHRFKLGDLNLDGMISFGDIDPFVLALSDPYGYQQQYRIKATLHGDINQDGQITFNDIDPFVALLSNG